MLLSSSQIRAARAFLNWNQDDLAQKTDLSRPTIVNIEAGHQDPGAKTIKKILSVFEEQGLRFTANDGIRKRKDYVRIYRGVKEAFEFFDFILSHSKKTLDPVYLNNVNPSAFRKNLPGFFESNYVKGMSKLGDKIDVKLIAREDDLERPVKKYAEYRSVSREKFNASIPMYVFGNYFAIIMFLDEPTIFLIKDKKTADAYKGQFMALWKQAKKDNQKQN